MFRSALIIDDDPLYLIVAQETLAMQGIKDVTVAEDGYLGLGQVQNRAFDLVICDLQMPNIDGITLIRKLGDMSFRGQLVIVSSEPPKVLETVYRMAQLSGVRVLGFLQKPLTFDALAKVLSKEVGAANASGPKISKAGLIDAIDSGIIVPHYQPKFDLINKRIVSAEALARIDDGGGKISSAWPYLQAAETYDCTRMFTLEMFKQVLKDKSEKNWDSLDIAINVSPKALDIELPDDLSALCAAAGVSQNTITLELTENALLGYSADTLQILSRFRLKGFRLSLDDFGTGSTSIEQLRLYPFNELKIDKSFVQDADTSAFSKAALESSAKLAAMCDMEVVAEGVETAEQLRTAFKAGARYIQGYYIAKPSSADVFQRIINVHGTVAA